MTSVLLTLLRLVVAVARVSGRGGVRAVIAENLLLKQQLIVLRRTRRRAPNLTRSDRLLLGIGSLFLRPSRIRKLAIALRSSTLLAFHQTLVRRKHRLLFSSRPCPKKPGPSGPDRALIGAIVELKSRNPRFGCSRIARIISQTFGIDIDKNVVYRVLATTRFALRDRNGRVQLSQPRTRNPLFFTDFLGGRPLLSTLNYAGISHTRGDPTMKRSAPLTPCIPAISSENFSSPAARVLSPIQTPISFTIARGLL